MSTTTQTETATMIARLQLEDAAIAKQMSGLSRDIEVNRRARAFYATTDAARYAILIRQRSGRIDTALSLLADLEALAEITGRDSLEERARIEIAVAADCAASL